MEKKTNIDKGERGKRDGEKLKKGRERGRFGQEHRLTLNESDSQPINRN